MLTLSVQPLITLHFCRGELHSFAVGGTDQVNACCITSDSAENSSFDMLSTNFTKSSNSCCSFQRVEIITDDFTVEHTNATIQKPITSLYIQVSAILNNLIDLVASEPLVKNNSPTSFIGLYNNTLKYLSYICVYRL